MSHLPAAAPPSGRLDASRALWLQGLILASFLAASSAPSPLYAVYREAWGFSALTLTVVFSSYAMAMLAALIFFGALSDYRGRREVIMVALVLEFATVLLFLNAESVGWLLAARVLQGVATGIAASALGAGLVDLHPERGALVNSSAPMVGLGVGALGTSGLVQFAPAPTRLTFELLLLVFALLLLAALQLPETAERRPGAWQSLKPNIGIPVKARAAMWEVLPVNTAGWALGGFYLALGPTLARSVTGDAAPLVGGTLIAVMTFSSALAISLTPRCSPRSALGVGSAALALGMAMTLAGILTHSAPAFFAGALVAGAGFGITLISSMRSLVLHAAPHERAGLISGYLVLSYVAFSLPVVAAGFVASHFGLQVTAIGFGVTLMALSAASLLLMARSRAH
jgi:hypothetical protein